MAGTSPLRGRRKSRASAGRIALQYRALAEADDSEYDRRALGDQTMAAVAFDTLKFARTLREKAKLTSEQAERVAQAFAKATGEQIATKSELREEISPVKADLLLVKWVMAFVLAFQVAIFAKTFIH
jgi:hypothetical protein